VAYLFAEIGGDGLMVIMVVNWCRVGRASSTLVGTEPLRFRVQILEIATHPDPILVGGGFTAKARR
jgi:hypothetical protein